MIRSRSFLPAASLLLGVTSITLLAVGPLSAQTFEFSVGPQTLEFDQTSGVGSGSIDVRLREVLLPGQPPAMTASFTAGLTLDSPALEIVDVLPGAETLALGGGDGPWFFHPQLYADGFGVSCIYHPTFGELLEFSTEGSVLAIEVATIASQLAGSGSATIVTPVGSGPPSAPFPIDTAVNIDGLLFEADWIVAPITLAPADLQTPFIRGDANGDGAVTSVPDAVAALGALFLPGATPLPCLQAADANDDGGVDIADPLYLLNFGFLGGPLPPAPYPACGGDPTIPLLSCDATPC